MKKIFLLDGNALIYRMFYALPDFTTKDGKHVSAIYGIAKFFIEDLKRENPDYLLFIRDARGKNFRHEIYSDYKATRERMPDNLSSQVDDINDMVSLFHTDVLEIPGVEADDVIATLALKLEKDKNNEIFILSGDKDLYSLVKDNVKILDIIKKDVFDEEKTREKFGVDARFITDYLALIGDSSDNIPGISGIGPKKAIPLINKLGNIEKIYEFIDSGEKTQDEELNKILSGKTLELIKNSKDIAFLSKKLATIKNDVDLSKDGFNLENYKFDENNLLNENIIELFKKYEFYSLIGKENKPEEKKWQDLGLNVQIIGDKEGLDGLRQLIDSCLLPSRSLAMAKHGRRNDEIVFNSHKNGNQSIFNEIVLDTETTSLNIIKAKLVGVSIFLDKKNIYYINLGHNGPKVEENDLKDFLLYLLNSDLTIIGHNLKYDLQIIELFIKSSNFGNNPIDKELKNNSFGQMSLGV